MFVECIQCVKARLRTKGGKWHAYAPGCDLAHEEGRLSRSACRPAKAVGELLRRNYYGGTITCQYLGAYLAPKVPMLGI